MKNIGNFSRKVQDSVTGLGRKNIRGDSKKESNESPEIPDMYSASFQHGNLHLLLMETSRVTLLHRPKYENVCATHNTSKKLREDFLKIKLNELGCQKLMR